MSTDEALPSANRRRIDQARRRMAMATDAHVARTWHRLAGHRLAARRHAGSRLAADRAPRSTTSTPQPTDLAMVVVNFSTTPMVRLMLATLAQQRLDRLTRIVVVDNGSRDGGLPFLRRLASEVDRIDLIERRHRLHHGPGMRAGLAHLDRIGDPAAAVVFVDSDVIFLDPHTLDTVAAHIDAGAALVGEQRRRGANRPGPNIQASFVTVTRNAFARPDIAPPLHDGAPLYRMQLDIERAGLPVVDFPSNHGGHILHRGRSGVAAAAQFRPGHAYATAGNQRPHFMGVPNGHQTWIEIEQRHAHFLGPDGDDALIDLLAQRLSR